MLRDPSRSNREQGKDYLMETNVSQNHSGNPNITQDNLSIMACYNLIYLHSMHHMAYDNCTNIIM